MRVAIVGASGLLGKYLSREWRQDEVIGFGSKDFDIRHPDEVTRIVVSMRPDWIVLAAAYTDVDGCELNPDRAFQTNTAGALNVANAAVEAGSRLLFLSSDYVFDGNKGYPYEIGDCRNPLNVYGRSKAEAEVRIAELIPDSCIVRTSWVFGTGGKCFPDTILKAAATRKELEVVNDQRGCPTYGRDLARAIEQLCRMNASGIVHVTNRGDCSWYEFASQIVGLSSLTTAVQPTTTDRFPRPARRPTYSVLSSRSLDDLRISMPSWQDALAEYLVARNQSKSIF